MKRDAAPWQPEVSAALNARRVLPELMRNYFRKGRKLDRDSSAKTLHGFRLKTKQLRYTLEAFVSVYGTGLNPKIASLRPIQNALGDFHDCVVLLSEMEDRLPPKARTHLEKRADEKRKEFLRYWQEKFDAKGEDKKWEKYLASSPRTRLARSRTEQK